MVEVEEAEELLSQIEKERQLQKSKFSRDSKEQLSNDHNIPQDRPQHMTPNLSLNSTQSPRRNSTSPRNSPTTPHKNVSENLHE